MSQFPSTQTQCDAANAGTGTTASAALSRSVLEITRDAIARWTGKSPSAAPLANDLRRISPQARWLSQAQCGLADWIARGGFSQADDDSPSQSGQLTGPCMYQVPATLPGHSVDNLDACVD
jgi:hypothetical protein